MPTLTDHLFDLVENDQFDAAKEFLQENPSLVNALDPGIKDHLICSVLATKNFSLIEFVVTRKELDFDFVSNMNQTVMDAILFYADPKVVNLVIDNPKSLINGGELSVECVNKLLIDANGTLERLRAKGNEKGIVRIIEKLNNLEKIKDILLNASIEKAKDPSPLRSALIRYCIETDNAGLFNQLKAKSLAPTSLITIAGKNVRPIDLLTENNVRLKPLFAAVQRESSSKLSLFTQRHRTDGIDEQLKKLEIEYKNQRAALHGKYIENDVGTPNTTTAVASGRRL